MGIFSTSRKRRQKCSSKGGIPKETCSSKRAGLQQATEVSVYGLGLQKCQEGFEKSALLSSDCCLKCYTYSFDLLMLKLFSNYNVSGRHAVKLQYHRINFGAFSYVYFAGKENEENKLEENELNQGRSHGMNMCLAQGMGIHLFCVIY